MKDIRLESDVQAHKEKLLTLIYRQLEKNGHGNLYKLEEFIKQDVSILTKHKIEEELNHLGTGQTINVSHRIEMSLIFKNGHKINYDSQIYLKRLENLKGEIPRSKVKWASVNNEILQSAVALYDPEYFKKIKDSQQNQKDLTSEHSFALDIKGNTKQEVEHKNTINTSANNPEINIYTTVLESHPDSNKTEIYLCNFPQPPVQIEQHQVKSDEIDSEDSSLPTIKITEHNSQKGSFYQTDKEHDAYTAIDASISDLSSDLSLSTEHNTQNKPSYQTDKGFIESLQNIIYQLLRIMHFTQAEEASTDHQSNQAPEYLINGSVNDSVNNWD